MDCSGETPRKRESNAQISVLQTRNEAAHRSLVLGVLRRSFTVGHDRQPTRQTGSTMAGFCVTKGFMRISSRTGKE